MVVDAPEIRQEDLEQNKNQLKVLSKNKKGSFIAISSDRYCRIVARVFLSNGSELNKLLIEEDVAKEFADTPMDTLENVSRVVVFASFSIMIAQTGKRYFEAIRGRQPL